MVAWSLPQLGSSLRGVMSFSGGGVPLSVTVPDTSPAWDNGRKTERVKRDKNNCSRFIDKSSVAGLQKAQRTYHPKKCGARGFDGHNQDDIDEMRLAACSA